jgi:hypothetical protein
MLSRWMTHSSSDASRHAANALLTHENFRRWVSPLFPPTISPTVCKLSPSHGLTHQSIWRNHFANRGECIFFSESPYVTDISLLFSFFLPYSQRQQRRIACSFITQRRSRFIISIVVPVSASSFLTVTSDRPSSFLAFSCLHWFRYLHNDIIGFPVHLSPHGDLNLLSILLFILIPVSTLSFLIITSSFLAFSCLRWFRHLNTDIIGLPARLLPHGDINCTSP